MGTVSLALEWRVRDAQEDFLVCLCVCDKSRLQLPSSGNGVNFILYR